MQKRLELLHGMVPGGVIIAVMVELNAARGSESGTRIFRAAVVTLGLQSIFWRH